MTSAATIPVPALPQAPTAVGAIPTHAVVRAPLLPVALAATAGIVLDRKVFDALRDLRGNA